MRSRTAFARARVTLFCWQQEQERGMAEQPPKHTPNGTGHPQPSEAERHERVKAHVKAVLKRMKARLRQSP